MSQPDTVAGAEPTTKPGVSDVPAAPLPGRAKKRWLWVASLCCALIALVLTLKARQPPVAAKLPDPVSTFEVVPVPKRPPDRGLVVSASAAVQTAPAAAVKSSAAGTGVTNPVAGGEPAPSPNVVAAACNDDKDVLDALQRNSDSLANLEQGLAELKAQLTKMAQVPKRSTKVSGAMAETRPMVVRPKPDADAAQLLSIDLWGGKPSVAVGRNRGDGTEVTFLNEGEKQGRVTVKRADVGSQRAVLSTDSGDVVLSRNE